MTGALARRRGAAPQEWCRSFDGTAGEDVVLFR
ncbi:hypothetical protein Ae406Ps2_1833 [Pseudonocardia sp. Ae406_Ps2]|nr:hypothetical protein Ae406Ps2_1833 [Pseudonocardia sp. Ae406_Ps2]OLM23404.1 hypothetical protein Ae706Ps2_1837 [Pseudonocardia sp. Ae706_Ps2]